MNCPRQIRIPFWGRLAHAGLASALAVNLLTAGFVYSAEIPATNAPMPWPPLAEVLKKWGDIPLDAVQRAAESGDLTAQHYLGYCYAEGFRLPQDFQKGVTWYQCAGNAGYMPSFNNLGFLYQQGKGVPQDYAKTVYYYHLAADGGFAVAQVNIGYLYRDGIGVQRDPVEAMKWFHRAADQGNAKAMVEIGRFYRYGQGVPRDSDEAIRWFQKAADKGEPLGRLNLGLFYYEEGNPEVAFNINQQAADEGNVDAMFMLYRAYWEGNGVAANHEKAMEWLAKAAEGGSATSQCVLGYRYEYPDDDSSNKPRLRNMPEAIKWYRLAAGQNHAGGQYHLGLCRLAGLGVEKDEERGLDLIREAADQNHPDSLLELAKLYARGIGEPRNERDLPMQLLQRAVQNDPQNKGAFDDLIFQYEYGAGMDRDMIAAVEWYCRAALAGVYDYSLEDKLEIGPSKRRPQATYSGESERPLILLRAPDSGEKSDRFLAVMSLYLKAARVNDLQVLMQIGEMYVTGRNDVPKSAAKAWSWFTLAAQRGDRDASAKIAKLEPNMTHDELNRARQILPGLVQELNAVGSALGRVAGSRNNQTNGRTP